MFPIHSIISTMLRSIRFVHNAIWPNVEVTAASLDIHVDWNVPVRVRDGTVLRVNVFRRKGEGRFPRHHVGAPLWKRHNSCEDPQRARRSVAVAASAAAASGAHLRVYQLGGARP